jgi:Lipocalin-like domain
MRQIIALAIAAAVMFGAETAVAADKIAGIWKLQSWVVEDVETKETKVVFGEQPNGFLILTSEGRLMGLITAQGRKPPQNEAERDGAYRSLLAYSGRYRVEGEKFVTKVDVAWNEAWVGTEQARDYKIDGNKLVVTSPPAPNPAFGGKPARGIFTFAREGG